MNVISAMMEIATNPVTADGRRTTPITYDSNCLEEICGSCAMLINGKARMACSALVDNLEQPIKVEPLSKFPLVRDLPGRPLRAVRKPDARQSMGPRRRHLRSRLRPARLPAAAGSQLPALQLHLLHLLHGGLPAVQRIHQLCGRRHHRPGEAVQQSPHRQSLQGRSPARAGRATAASRSAAMRRTAWKSAPRAFRSPMPSPMSAAMSWCKK